MSGSNPLAGLTGEQADEAIEALAAKVKDHEESLRAAKDHLKDLRAARKDLVEPQGPIRDGVTVVSGTAEVTAEGGEG